MLKKEAPLGASFFIFYMIQMDEKTGKRSTAEGVAVYDTPIRIQKQGGNNMDNVKKILGIYAGGIGGVLTALGAVAVCGVAAPVALGIGLTVAGASTFAVLSKDD